MKVKNPDFKSVLPNGYDSKKAIGCEEPVSTGDKTVFGDVTAPLGEVKPVPGG